MVEEVGQSQLLTGTNLLLGLDPSLSAAAKLNKRLNELLIDPDRGIEEVVVLALGAFDRYYVCWKNTTGEYQQDSHDLPEKLHEWLFLKRSERDFASLQVILGQLDEFYAYDKNGKLSASGAESSRVTPTKELDDDASPFRPLRRRTVPIDRQRANPETDERSQRAPEEAVRRLRTLSLPRARGSSLDSSSSSLSPAQTRWSRALRAIPTNPNISEDSSQPGKEGDQNSLFHRNRLLAARLRSNSIRSEAVPEVPGLPPSNTASDAPARPIIGIKTTLGPATSPPRYADASVQTNAVECICPRCALRDPGDAGDALADPADPNGIQPSAPALADVALAPTPPVEDPNTIGPDKLLSSPIIMGTMTHYFRSTNYQLGDMLRTSYMGYFAS